MSFMTHSLVTIAFFVLGMTAQASELKTVDYVDVSRYLGRWYEISHIPMFFEPAECMCAQQSLGVRPDGKVSVYNSCNDGSSEGPLVDIRGYAVNEDPTTNAKFIVDFGLPKKGRYWIIGLADDYRWAVVSEPSRNSLYILSKTPTLSATDYESALEIARNQNLDISRLKMTNHTGCQYPEAPASSGVLALPQAPSDSNHPGSKSYSYSSEKSSLSCKGRNVTVFLPKGADGSSPNGVPLVVFGHGQALDVSHYQGTLEHLAKKGIAAIHPDYDNGFFDQDWDRMGRDYLNLTDCVLNQHKGTIDANKIIFSGHSKGGYVASIAAGQAFGLNSNVKPRAVVLFAPAGADQKTLPQIGPQVSVTVVHSDRDTVVSADISATIYAQANSRKRQFIRMKSYGERAADHFWPLTKSSLFGGGSEGPYHYYGSWKWLTAAAEDLNVGGPFTNPYLYGSEAVDKGVSGLADDVERSW